MLNIFQTQVCVLQTTMDLLERNYNVHVLADGVSSRTMVERMFALEVMRCLCIHMISCGCFKVDRELNVYQCFSFLLVHR